MGYGKISAASSIRICFFELVAVLDESTINVIPGVNFVKHWDFLKFIKMIIVRNLDDNLDDNLDYNLDYNKFITSWIVWIS